MQVSQNTELPQINGSIKRWATELNRTFSKEEIQIVKKTHEKMLILPGHKGNANKNHTKNSPHPCYSNYQ
jgi:hypothetical protein